MLGHGCHPGNSPRALVAKHPSQSTRPHAKGRPALQRSCHPDRRPLPSDEVTALPNTATNFPLWFPWYRYLLAACFFLSLSSDPAHAFRIVSPADGATLVSGQTVPVAVEAGREAGLVEVRYYWYPEQTEALVEQAAGANGAGVAGKACHGAKLAERQHYSAHPWSPCRHSPLPSTVVPPYGGAFAHSLGRDWSGCVSWPSPIFPKVVSAEKPCSTKYWSPFSRQLI